MATISDAGLGFKIRPIMGSIQASVIPPGPGEKAPPPPPFITIARQAGAGAWTLAQRLVEHFNRDQPELEKRWTAWDKELVEKVAADHHISGELVESLGEVQRSWLEDLFQGIQVHQASASEFEVYRRVAATVRALATAGRVVIVGRGGLFITRNMDGGIHVRLVAPLPWRIDFMRRKLNCSHARAAEHVHRIEAARAAFYKRYWPQMPLDAEAFDAVYNTATLSDEQLVASIAGIVAAKIKA